jgi:hypothetical protein
MGLGDKPPQPLALSLSKGGLQRSDPGFDKLSPSGVHGLIALGTQS